MNIDDLETGDMILFSGITLYQNYRIFSGSKYSHAGVIIKNPDFLMIN